MAKNSVTGGRPPGRFHGSQGEKQRTHERCEGVYPQQKRQRNQPARSRRKPAAASKLEHSKVSSRSRPKNDAPIATPGHRFGRQYSRTDQPQHRTRAAVSAMRNWPRQVCPRQSSPCLSLATGRTGDHVDDAGLADARNRRAPITQHATHSPRGAKVSKECNRVSRGQIRVAVKRRFKLGVTPSGRSAAPFGPALRVVGRFSDRGLGRLACRKQGAARERLGLEDRGLWVLSGSNGSILTGMTGGTSAPVIPRWVIAVSVPSLSLRAAYGPASGRGGTCRIGAERFTLISRIG